MTELGSDIKSMMTIFTAKLDSGSNYNLYFVRPKFQGDNEPSSILSFEKTEISGFYKISQFDINKSQRKAATCGNIETNSKNYLLIGIYSLLEEIENGIANNETTFIYTLESTTPKACAYVKV